MKLLIVFVLAFNVCMGVNIVEKAEELGATTLLDFLVKANLNGTLSGTGPFTVFAPTNEAFAALPPSLVTDLENNITLLTSVLTYHVVAGSVMSSALQNELLAASLAGPQIRFNIYGTGDSAKVLATGAQVTLADQAADNGVIHVVNKVMMAPAGTIPAIATATSDLSTLVTALTTAELVDAVTGGNLTVFAPTNAAFAAVPGLDEILADKERLTGILQYHVVPATVYSAGLSNNQEVTTLQGSQVKITIDGGTVKVEDSTVTTADIPALNGVVHIIDKVLDPNADPNSAQTTVASLVTVIIAATTLLAYF